MADKPREFHVAWNDDGVPVMFGSDPFFSAYGPSTAMVPKLGNDPDHPEPYAVIEMTRLPDGPQGERQIRARILAADGSESRAESAVAKEAVDAAWLGWCERSRLASGDADA